MVNIHTTYENRVNRITLDICSGKGAVGTYRFQCNSMNLRYSLNNTIISLRNYCIFRDLFSGRGCFLRKCYCDWIVFYKKIKPQIQWPFKLNCLLFQVNDQDWHAFRFGGKFSAIVWKWRLAVSWWQYSKTHICAYAGNARLEFPFFAGYQLLHRGAAGSRLLIMALCCNVIIRH